MHKSAAFIRLALAGLLCMIATACGGGGGGSFSSGSGGGTVTPGASITIHYKRIAGDYSGWGLHLYNDSAGSQAIASGEATTWTSPHPFDGVTGGYDTATIPLINANANLNFIVHNGDAKSPMPNLSVNRATFGGDVWIIQDTATLYASQADADAAALRVGHQADSIDMSPVAIGATASALPAGWNKNAHFMEIFVRSYKDSDGDGKGDIKGLISQLDYLKSLGVTGLWLMPVFKSEDHDHGYAVVDYRSLEPDYGTMADFDNLITQAHARGIGIILDYVMNHSADQNPVFLDAESSTANARRDWYVFSPTDLNWTGFDGDSWRASESGFYYGVFDPAMPDWNLKNQTVINYHLDNLRFWLNKGVDGFRFDAAESFIENGASQWQNQPQNHAILLQAQNVINSYANRYMVCEAADDPADYAQPTSCINAFAFGRQGDIIGSAATQAVTSGMVSYLTATNRSHMPLFLSNHDSFAGARPINSLSGHNEGDYRIAAAIELLASDTPFTLYGEEIGMANGGAGGDAGIRAPMSWTHDAATAGFSTGTPYRGLSANLATHNVSDEDGTSGSLHDYYKSLYALRNAWPVLESGSLTLLSSAGDSKLVFLRQSGGQTAVVIINLGLANQTIGVDTGLDVTTFNGAYPTTGSHYVSGATGHLSIVVPAQGVVVLVTP